MLHFDIACDTLPCLQEHLRDVYFRRKPSTFVTDYEKPCKTRAERRNRIMSGGWGPLLEHDDIVRILAHSKTLLNICTSSKRHITH